MKTVLMTAVAAIIGLYSGVALSRPEGSSAGALEERDMTLEQAERAMHRFIDPQGTVDIINGQLRSYDGEEELIKSIDLEDDHHVSLFQRAQAARAEEGAKIFARVECNGKCIANDNCTSAACPNCGSVGGYPNPYEAPYRYCWGHGVTPNV